MPSRPLPAFLIIGAVKAATTWISHQLRQHPSTWLPKAEPHFFSSEYHRGADWYLDLFAQAPPGHLIGEKSADYLAHPQAAARIARMLPGVPMIVQLRDPVDRAYSDYCMYFRRGLVGGEPRRYLDPRIATERRFLDGGLYGQHIARLLDHHAAEQLNVILYEDIQREPKAVVASVCRHIGVEPCVSPLVVAERKNDSASPLLPLPLRKALRPARPLLDPLRSNPFFSGLRSSMARPVAYPPLTPELRGTLQDFYAPDLEMLGKTIGRDLAAWTSARAARTMVGQT